ncbi:transcriptional regulator [Bifidobacterium dolichotidis]|uniref:Transcriptional regulator n=1 Tax=Bifidobacterium dolichotidis TaxID=2306976 RepID=A0A430FSP2_9BIFI|nr:LCP family protein [Bifidobacterium dolichotidis]RSX55870.1 transcriptional regulator [Bifidobacterium dolichotidis]
MASHSKKHSAGKTPHIGKTAGVPPQHTAAYAATRLGRRVIACILVALLAFIGTAAAMFYLHIDGAVQENKIDFVSQHGEGEEILDPNADKPITFLLIGQDSRDGENKALSGGTAEEEGIHNSDTTMVVQISADRDFVNIISIPRDSIVDTPSCKTTHGTIPAQYGVMFNSIFSNAYSVGGDLASAASCTVNAVNDMTGLDIQNFVVVDFQGLFNMIDAIGGVDVCIPVDMKDQYTELDLKKGWNHLYGLQATEYARMRHGTGTDGSDIMRTTRQQYLIKSLFKEVTKKNMLTQSNQLYKLALDALHSLNFSSGMAHTGALAGLAWSLRNLHVDHIYAQTVPVVPAPTDPNRVVWAPTAADELWAKIRHDQPLYGSDKSDEQSPAPENTASPSPEATQTPAPENTQPAPNESQPAEQDHFDERSGLIIKADGTMIDPNTNGIVEAESGAIRDPATGQYIGMADKYLDNVVCGVPNNQ